MSEIQENPLKPHSFVSRAAHIAVTLSLLLTLVLASTALAEDSQTSAAKETPSSPEAGDAHPELAELGDQVTVIGQSSRIVTKAETPILLLPQAVSVAPDWLLEEQQLTNLTEAIPNVRADSRTAQLLLSYRR